MFIGGFNSNNGVRQSFWAILYVCCFVCLFVSSLLLPSIWRQWENVSYGKCLEKSLSKTTEQEKKEGRMKYESIVVQTKPSKRSVEMANKARDIFEMIKILESIFNIA